MSLYLWVDPIACRGNGTCAELLAEWISLDDWGYPIIEQSAIPAALRAHVKRAIASCPTLALSVRDSPQRPVGRPDRHSGYKTGGSVII